MKIIDDIPVWGDPIDENAVLQMKNTLNNFGHKGAIMADHHQGYCNLPVGGVVAYEGFVNASGIGSDIACIAEGTKITTGSGSLVKIEDISKKNVGLTMQSPSFLVESNILGISKK